MIREYHNYSLLPHNTFGIDVTASRFIEYDTPNELCELISSSRIEEPYLHIGQGSNLLFVKDFEGTVLHSRIKSIDITDETTDSIGVRVGAGVRWDDFVLRCVENNWYGIENLSYIPGETGACTVQNIGAYGTEIKDFISNVETINLGGEKQTYSVEECKYAYRYSIFKEPDRKDCFVTYVYFKLSKTPHYVLDYGTVREAVAKYPEVSLKIVRKVIIDIRKSKLPDPQTMGNAGSFFVNPVIPCAVFETIQKEYPQMPYYKVSNSMIKIPTAWLIEQCGWKGKALGPAAVHDKQPLVLVNRGGAKGTDILKLADAVRASVKERFNIEIHPEVSIIGQ
ncbi:UDP-N-acetylenolpyruvoylglucosamine reductase [termite gut metagenome]|uniref:UDP-N-acetylmuramate dehydrogenase n=1 Tax=termite gut metagenome TaxID=433724 RepID=A0A5J4RL45_9ZZZZ